MHLIENGMIHQAMEYHGVHVRQQPWVFEIKKCIHFEVGIAAPIPT